jgi:hypothetical protein
MENAILSLDNKFFCTFVVSCRSTSSTSLMAPQGNSPALFLSDFAERSQTAARGFASVIQTGCDATRGL